MNPPPFVSVIVPVFNGEAWIDDCLSALRGQLYPADRYEIIVVDNGSTDDTRSIVAQHGVVPEVETGIRSPYAARNRALAFATGEILAFTDSDCVPAADWLDKGIGPIRRGDADMVGGEVRFMLGERPSTGTLLDATINVEMRRNIESRGAAKTANLLVHRRVIGAQGPFPAAVRSGGDVAWTMAATAAGFRLVFEKSAIVQKRPRDLGALLRKQRRVGRGHVRLWAEGGASRPAVLLRTLTSFLPRPPWKYSRMKAARGLASVRHSAVRLWLAGWLASVATGVGRLEGLMAREWKHR